MQVKTIEKNIENKVIDWINSINEKSVKKYLKSDIIVTGGCISSMFLQEDVNDYDIYIKNMDILVALAKYYTKDYPSIVVLDGRKQTEYLSKLKKPGIEKIAIENLKYNQIKLFFTDKNGGYLPKHSINEKKDGYVPLFFGYVPVFFSPNAITLSNNIQIVLRFNGNPEEIHKNFDFIHATNYFTFKEGLVTNKQALESLLTKQLKYQGSLYPLTSIIRMKKFIKRGWNINAGEILKIMFQISELDLKDPNVLEEQLIGVDVAYFQKLIELLRDTTPEKITSHYLNTLIDRVFNESTDETGI